MKQRHALFPTFLLVLLLVATIACGPGDPRAEVLEQRARWNVQLLDWVQNSEGSLNLSTRISGPTHSPLERLTVCFVLTDAAENTLAEKWHTFDLTQISRGGPKDLLVALPADGLTIEGVGLKLALEPTPEEESKIVELSL